MRRGHGAILAALSHLLGAWLAASCARRPEMSLARHDPRLIRPADGKALVMFIRPARYFGKAIGVSVYDDERFLGLLTSNTVVAYQAAPGEHVFMLLSGQPTAPAFLDASLAAGRAYYVDIAPRSSWTRPPFHLVPLHPESDKGSVEAWLRDANLLVIDDRARQWERENQASVEEKRQDGLREWRQRNDRATIDASYGVELPREIPGTVIFSSVSEPATAPGDAARDPAGRLRQLDSLREQGLVTEEEYQEKRRSILRDF